MRTTQPLQIRGGRLHFHIDPNTVLAFAAS
jgi:hypothetical protein